MDSGKILVEVKYLTSQSDPLTTLHEHCFAFGCEEVTDIYYDTPRFDFALQNHFLRYRDHKYMLKIGAHDFNPLFPSFTEFVAPQQIAHLTKIGKVGERYIAQGERDLSSFNLRPILNISFRREIFTLLWTEGLPTDLRLGSSQWGAVRVSIETQKNEDPRVRFKLFISEVSQKEAARKFIMSSAKQLNLTEFADHHGKFQRTLKQTHPALHRKMIKKELLAQ